MTKLRKKESENSEDATENSGPTAESSKEPKPENGEKTESKSEDKKPVESNETVSNNDTAAGNGSATNATEEIIEKKIEEKIVPVKEVLKFSVEIKDSIPMTEADIKKSKDKLVALSLRDLEKLETAKALNDLESFIIGQQEKFENNENTVKVTSETERADLSQKLSAASDWLYDDGMGLTSVEYKAKLTELKTEFKPVFARLREVTERPKAINLLLETINRTEVFLNMSGGLLGDMQVFTPVEIESLNTSYNDVKTFLADAEKQISEANPHEMPPVTVSDFKMKGAGLERDLIYLVNKMKNFKPPKPKTTKAPEKDAKKDSNPAPDVEEDNEDLPTEGSEKKPEDTTKEPKDEKPETLELPGADESIKPDETTPRTDL